MCPASARDQQKHSGPEALQGASATHSFLPAQNARGFLRLRLFFLALASSLPRTAANVPNPTAESAPSAVRREDPSRSVRVTASNRQADASLQQAE